MSEVTKNLEALLADVFSVYVKTLNYHWNITGPNFIALHELLQKHYEELAAQLDDIAERIRILGGKVKGELKHFCDSRTLKDGNKVDWKDMLTDLVSDYNVIHNHMLEIIKSSTNSGDDVTADILTGFATSIGKNRWMLESHLK